MERRRRRRHARLIERWMLLNGKPRRRQRFYRHRQAFFLTLSAGGPTLFFKTRRIRQSAIGLVARRGYHHAA